MTKEKKNRVPSLKDKEHDPLRLERETWKSLVWFGIVSSYFFFINPNYWVLKIGKASKSFPTSFTSK